MSAGRNAFRLQRASGRPMLEPVKGLAPGFLIAMPQLGDPHFQKTVVLMIEHNDEGSMGLVLNRAASLTLKELAKGQALPLARERAAEVVFMGGPVDRYRGFVLHDSLEIEEKVEVIPGVFLSMTSDALKPLLVKPEGRIRFCLGYSGWGPGQIEAELAQGSWLFTEAQAESTLSGDPDLLWDSTLKGMGVDPAMLVTTGGIN